MTTTAMTVDALRGSASRLRKERAVQAVLFGAAAFSVLVTVAIVFTLFGRALSFLADVKLSQIWSSGWYPRRGTFGIRPLLLGSLMITVIAMAIAGPLGVGSAVYLSEYASPRVRRLLKPVMEVLSGIPSVVLGLFALTVISPQVVQRLFSGAGQFNLLAAGIGVGILTIPLVATISEDALRAVPDALREASYGCGARKRDTVLKVVLPAAVSGLVAAFIVATSRAVGETMVVAIAAGSNGQMTWNPTEPGKTMTGAMAELAKGTDQVAGSGSAFKGLFFIGLCLFLITFVLNVLADRFVQRVRQQY
jgi:phosphate transport system permease protein